MGDLKMRATLLCGFIGAINSQLVVDTTLREAASGLDIHIGTAMNYNKGKNLDAETKQTYESTDYKNFDSMTAENQCKASAMVSGPKIPDDVNLKKCKQMRDWANDQDMVFRGHTLFWPSYD